MERTLDQINKEFTDLVVKAGQLQYQIYALEHDLDLVNSAIKDLNFEAAKLSATKNAEKKAALSAVSAENTEGSNETQS